MWVKLLKNHKSGFTKGQVKDLHPLSAKRLIADGLAEETADPKATNKVQSTPPAAPTPPPAKTEVKEDKDSKETKGDKGAAGRETKEEK
jgi:hypothetical protein